MTKDKIGLFTWFKNGNYGTILQAYALKNVLGSFYDCEIVNYKGENSKYKFKDLFDKRSRKLVIARVEEKLAELLLKKTYSIPHNEKVRKFSTFIDDYLEVDHNYITKVELEKLQYKYYVCGSDQIWNPCHFDSTFFLDFVKSGKKIAYAPSFGVYGLDDYPKEKELIKKYLKSFDTISVREVTGQSIIEKLVGEKVPLCLDPTLLLSKNDWDTFSSNSEYSFPDKYIYCLFLGNYKQHMRKVNKIADILELKSYLHCYNLIDYFGKEYKFKDLSPVDFVSAIKNASFVCTDSFHATVFAILFHKPFICYKRFSEKEKFSQNSRIENLLQLTGFSDRLGLESKSVSELLDVSFSISDEWINSMKAQSIHYLQKAFNEEVE